MNFKEVNGDYSWKENGEDAKGYYFILSDAALGNDYKVTLIKDNNNITVNGAYVKTFPKDIADVITKKINCFRAEHFLHDKMGIGGHGGGHGMMDGMEKKRFSRGE